LVLYEYAQPLYRLTYRSYSVHLHCVSVLPLGGEDVQLKLADLTPR